MNINPWSKNELKILCDNFGTLRVAEIKELLPNKSSELIRKKAIELGLTRAGQHWQEYEDKIILENGHLGIREIMKLLPNRRKIGIRDRMLLLGIKSPSYWSKEEEQLLIDNYCTKEIEEILKLFPKRNKESIKSKAFTLGLKRNERTYWSEKDIEILKDNYSKMPLNELQKLLEKSATIAAIKCKAQLLGLKRYQTPKIPKAKKTPVRAIDKWTTEQDETLIKIYSDSDKQYLLSKFPNRTFSSIKYRAHILKLKRNKEFFSKEEKEYILNNYGKIKVEEIQKNIRKCSAYSICKFANSYGLESKICNQHKYTINHEYFSEPGRFIANNYWSGYFAADCNIDKYSNSVRFGISIKDIDAMYALKEHCGSNAPIRFYMNKDKKRNREHPMCCINLTSIQWLADLEKHYNIVRNKSLILQPPNLTNFIHKLEWIIGMADGDGYTSINTDKTLTIGFCGTYAVLSWIKQVLEELCPSLSQNNVVQAQSIYGFKFTGAKAFEVREKLLNLTNLPFKLERKWCLVNIWERYRARMWKKMEEELILAEAS